MAAGQGFKTFTTGEVLTAADVNGYLMQGVLVFASEAARDAAITSPQEGQFAYTKDNNSLWYYTGSAWASSGATGDIEGVTAGVGISGGGTSGTVTITNSMATAIDAKGDLVVGTGADTFSRLAVGANDTVLTADSTTATGTKWATVAAGGMTLLSTTSAAGSTVTISSISQSYKDLVIITQALSFVDACRVQIRLNGTSVYNGVHLTNEASTFSNNRTNSYIELSPAVDIAGSDTTNAHCAIIKNYANTSYYKPVQIFGRCFNANGSNTMINGGGAMISTSALTSITVVNTVGSFNGGQILIYGVN